MQDGPVTVRFTGHRAVVEDWQGGVIEYLWLTTLDEVRYRTTKGEGMTVFGQGGPTIPLQHSPARRRCDAEILDQSQPLALGALLRWGDEGM